MSGTGNGIEPEIEAEKPPEAERPQQHPKTGVELAVDRLKVRVDHHEALLTADRSETKELVLGAKKQATAYHEEAKNLIAQLSQKTEAGLTEIRAALGDVSKALGILARAHARETSNRKPAARRRKGA